MHEGFTDLPQDPSKDIPILHTRKILPSEPEITWIELMTNFSGATWRLFGAKTRVAPKSIVQERRAICDTCHYWDGNARLGFGKCNHQKCGCTKVKLLLATEACPIGSWGTYAD